MDAEQFDALTRLFLLTASRRLLLASLTSGLLAAVPVTIAVDAADRGTQGRRTRRRNARERLVADRRKRRKRKPHRGVNSPPPPAQSLPPPPALPPSSPPPPPPPLPTGPGSCGDTGNAESFGSLRRWAQTFLPPQGGQLRAVRIFLRNNPADYTLTFEVRTVDSQGVPTNTVLDSATVFNIPATAYTDPPRPVDATFASPASITLGQLHALSVTGPDNQYDFAAYRSNNICPDGKLFFDRFADGSFTLAGPGPGLPGADLVYAVSIV